MASPFAKLLNTPLNRGNQCVCTYQLQRQQRNGRLDWNGEGSDSGQSAAPQSTVYRRGSANDDDDKPVPVRCLCVSCHAGHWPAQSVFSRGTNLCCMPYTRVNCAFSPTCINLRHGCCDNALGLWLMTLATLSRQYSCIVTRHLPPPLLAIYIHHRRCYYYSVRKMILILSSRGKCKAEST